MEETLLKVENLKRYFQTGKRTFKAVDDVSFEIKKGETFGLVGESGSGKTTTGRSIIRLQPVTGGRVYFEGQLIVSGEKAEWKALRAAESKKGRKTLAVEGIKMIFQDPYACLNPRMSVRELVAEGLLIAGVNRVEIEKRVLETLSLVGLPASSLGRYPHEFSGGQRQRIGIARALVTRPKLVIADEPVSALDVSVQAQVVNLLDDLKKQLGLTVLFIAHDLSVVKYVSDRIAVMHQGKILELAPADELFENPLHDYTRALISAIPRPDPRYEKRRVRTRYEPTDGEEETELLEVQTGHFVRVKRGKI